MEKKAGISDWFKIPVQTGKTVYGLELGLSALAGIAGGYGLARITAPESLTDKKSMDRELVREALKSEIDATERRIAALQRRRAELAERKTERPYDRFV